MFWGLYHFSFLALSKSFPHYSLLKCWFTSWNPGQAKELTVVLCDTAAILTFYFLAFHLTPRLYLWKSVAMTTLSGWWDGIVRSVWQPVPHSLGPGVHRGRRPVRQLSLLNLLITTRGGWTGLNKLSTDCLCVCHLKKKKKAQPARKMKALKLICCNKMYKIKPFFDK